MTVWSIVVAGGSGSRFGGAKQYAPLGGRRVLDWSLQSAREASDGVVLVVPAGRVDEDEGGADVVVAGGATRTASVASGLAVVPDDADVVVVHDAVRPLASPELFRSVVAAVRAGADAAVPGVPVVDTVKRVDAHGRVAETLDRAALVAVQTPQAFAAAVLRAAHADGVGATDDAALVERRGGVVVVVPGERGNRKVTHAEDLSALVDGGSRR